LGLAPAIIQKQMALLQKKMSISRQKHGLVSAQDFLVMLLQDRSGGSLVCTFEEPIQSFNPCATHQTVQ